MQWIKVENHLVKKSETMQLAGLLGVSRHEAVGLCVEFWSWADYETEDGRLPGITKELIDGIVGRVGFVDAMLNPQVGWLTEENGVFVIPKFERHNGNSTKRRLAAAERQFKRRVREGW